VVEKVRCDDKYNYMEIEPITSMPKGIPVRATEKIDFRCFFEVKKRIKQIADTRQSSMTKVILEALDDYLPRAIC
jgi:hypothetical protein